MDEMLDEWEQQRERMSLARDIFGDDDEGGLGYDV